MEKRPEAQPQIKRYLLSKAAAMRTPMSGTFELTPRCNFNCKMCYIHMTEAELARTGQRERTAREWLALGKTAVENGMLFLLLTGGEPLLRKDFFEIYEGLRSMGLLISINSNASYLDEPTIERLAQNPPTELHVTLYGGSNETYERLCGVKNGFDLVTKNIVALKQKGIPVDLNASFTRDNVDDIERIYAFAKEHELKVRATSYMFPPVRSGRATDTQIRFTAKEAGEARARFTKCGRSEAECQWLKEQLQKGVAAVLPEEDDCGILRDADTEMKCMAGRGSFWVTWDGRMTPCGMLNAPAARPFEDGFLQAWKYTVQHVGEIHLPPACVSCKKKDLCLLCGALSTAEGDGDSTKKPEYLCEMTDAYMEAMMR